MDGTEAIDGGLVRFRNGLCRRMRCFSQTVDKGEKDQSRQFIVRYEGGEVGDHRS